MDARRKAVSAPRLTNAKIVVKSMEIIGKENGVPKAAPWDIDFELFWMREACVHIARRRARFSKKHKRAIKNFATALRKAIVDLPEDLRQVARLDLILHNCEAYEKMSLNPKPDAFEKRLAAEAALRLCNKFGVAVNTTKEGAFCKLAAILNGDEDADLQHHCRAAKSAKPGQK